MMMKSIFVVLFCLMSTTPVCIEVAQASSQDANAYVIEIPVRALLSPRVGFEEKNNIQVVLYGNLPTGCYTLGESVVEKLADGVSIVVHQFATRDLSGICADESTTPPHMLLPVPFTAVVSVGHLEAGSYQFLYKLENGSSGTRTVLVSPNVTSSVDSLPYAATSSAYAPDLINGKDDVKVKISGVLNSTCTSLDEHVRVKTEDDVFVLLPTIKVQSGVKCGQIMIPFEKEVNLGKTFPGIHLIHVRSMNGNSVNKVIVVSK